MRGEAGGGGRGGSGRGGGAGGKGGSRETWARADTLALQAAWSARQSREHVLAFRRHLHNRRPVVAVGLVRHHLCVCV